MEERAAEPAAAAGEEGRAAAATTAEVAAAEAAREGGPTHSAAPTNTHNSRYFCGQRRGLPPRRQLRVRPEHDRVQSCAIALRSPASERSSDLKRSSAPPPRRRRQTGRQRDARPKARTTVWAVSRTGTHTHAHTCPSPNAARTRTQAAGTQPPQTYALSPRAHHPRCAPPPSLAAALSVPSAATARAAAALQAAATIRAAAASVDRGAANRLLPVYVSCS